MKISSSERYWFDMVSLRCSFIAGSTSFSIPSFGDSSYF